MYALNHLGTPRSISRRFAPGRTRAGVRGSDGKDVRLGGGVATVREFLDADLIDQMHFAVAPIELGRGERLWDSPTILSTVSS